MPHHAFLRSIELLRKEVLPKFGKHLTVITAERVATRRTIAVSDPARYEVLHNFD